MDNKKMMMKNKKAWLRIVEAFIGILIIITMIIIILNEKNSQEDISSVVQEKQSHILEIISKNDILRSEILAGDNERVNEIIAATAPTSWEFATNICDIDASCPLPVSNIQKEVYVSEIVISSNTTAYQPKKLRLFVWMR